MKSLSRRMKRMLAILLVETIVAVNVISSYASDAGGIMTFSEEEVSEMASNVEGGSSDSSEPVTEEPTYEEPAEEAPQEETPTESPAAEEPQETPADPEQSPTVDPVAEEPSLVGEDAVPEETPGNEQQPAEGSEEASECTCAKACGTSEYDAECPVCRAVTDLEESEREAFLKDHCSKYEEVAEEEKEKDDITEPEIINKESNITITGTSVADGAAIEGASDFTIEVSGEVTLSDKAPAIEGYEFSGRIYLKDTDTEVSKIKKEAVEDEKKENGVVTQIVKETKLSYFDVEAEDWVELTEDTTVVYDYTKIVQEEEAADEAVVRFYAVCVDEDGDVIDGFEKEELTVGTSLDLTKTPIAIDGYDYTEASVDGTVVLSVEKDATNEENTVYSYTTADGSVEVTEDVTVTLSYEMTEEEKAAVHFYAECVDEDGNLIGGYEKKTLRFEDTMDLAKAPFEIEGYEYVEASIGEAIVLSVARTTETDENGDEAVACTYTTADGSVEVSEDTTVTLTYQAVGEVKEVVLSWSYVDEDGNAIEGVEGEPEFEDILVLDDAEKAPVAVEGYEYVEASIDGTVITSITKETEQTEEADAEPVVAYSYTTTTGETVAIEEDTEITLSYEETGIPVKVDASVVDEFGDEIDDKYTNMELPKFTDGELVLDDVENPPVAKVQVRKSLFKVVKYTYVQATIDNKIVAAMKREATKDTADLAEKEQEFIYSYTTDGTTWTKLKEDTTVIFEYTDGKKTVYTYEDAYVSVTATLQHANAIPDDAEFVVTPVTSGTSGYNYGAYMDALNAAAISGGSDDQKTAYDETNTLLYDIAFLAAPVDEEGNTIEGELVEYQPAEGMVNISIFFKQSQLEDDLAAKDEKDITVVHMPLSDSVKESVSTTADATGISASDINVEVVSDSTSVAGEKTEFVLSDFSVVAVTAEGTKVMKAGPSVTYDSVLGEAANYGIVANEMKLAGHLESNFATGFLHGNADIQASKNQGGGAGYTYIGAYDGSNFKMDLNKNAGSLKIYTTEAAMRNFGSNMTGVKAGYEGDLSGVHFPTGVIVDYTTYSEADIKSKVSSMVSDVRATSAALMSAGETYGYEYSEIKDQYQNVIDIASLGADESGTYYINFQPGEFPICAYTIKIKSGQNVVLNIPDTSVSFGQFMLVVDGTKYTTQGASDEEVVCENVIFNCPNATYAKTSGATTGTFLVPNADFDNDSVAAGFLVANNIRKIGGQEWHSISKNIPVVNPTSFELTAVKTVNGKTPSADENGLFTFTVSSVDANGNETVIETVKNKGSAITFKRFDNIKQAGTYWYKIQETGTVDGYGIDSTLYYAKVEVTSVTQDLVTSTNATVTYYKGSMDGEVCGIPTFNNTKIEKGALSITKSVAGNTTSETFYFKVLDAQGTSVSWNGKTVFEIKSGETVTLTELPMGTYTIQETDKSGVAVAYDAAKFPYQVSYSSSNVLVNADQMTSATITNTYNPSKVSISGEKTWNDNDNQDGGRPVSVTINLLADGIKIDSMSVTEKDSWKWNFTGLDEYKDGKKIVYTITEDAVTGYTTAITGDAVSGYVVTNTHIPETVGIFGEKVWDDNNNQDGVRPDSITVKLLADGKNTGKTTTTTAGQNWRWSFTNLAKYADGKEITYTVTEEAVANYTTSSITKDEEKGFVITNTHTPEETQISVTKKWNDNDDQDGVRPSSVKVTLNANGTKASVKDAEVTLNAENNWTYTWTQLDKKINGDLVEYTVSEEGDKNYTTVEIKEVKEGSFEITNSHTPDKTSRTVQKVWDDEDNQDGIRPTEIKVILKANGEKASVKDAEVTLSAENNWTYTWMDLDLKAGKKEITYTVEEIIENKDVRNAYSTAIGYENQNIKITNTHNPATVFVKGSKKWDDNNDQDGVRPASITIQLYADGVLKDSKEVTEKNDWKWEFDNLPKYANGKQIQYSVREVLSEKDATNYTSENVSKTFDIKNTHTPVKTEISGIKIWDDEDNQDGIRPASITVKLFANGVDTGKTATASEATGWEYTFTELDKYANGSEIKYTVQEINVADGYKDSYSENGLDVTNTHTPETITINGSKIWDDNNNQDGKRPTEITVILSANGTEKAREKVTADTSGNWSFSFTNLPKYENGKAVKYTVKEEIADKAARDAYTTTVKGTTITNTHVPEKTSVSGTKSWSDVNDQDRVRPDSVTIKLLANGKETGKTAKATKDNNWTYSFENLDVYVNGVKITYTVQEDVPEGYTATYTTTDSGYDITNSYAPEKVNINGTKAWVDADNQDGIRPSSIVIKLYADGQYTGKYAKVTAESNWSWSFDDLDKNKDGQAINYTVTENPVEGYTTAITGEVATGFTVTNTHTPETVDISGTKEWKDNKNQDGVRPDSITIRLYADGTEIRNTKVTAGDDNSWSWRFTDLPKYKNVNGKGVAIVYTISEDAIIKGEATVYKASITGEAATGFTVTNTHTPETVDVSGTKTWVDNDDQDGVRPESIKVTLYADGVEADSKTVTAKDNWKYSFTNLAKYKNVDGKGVAIQYTITETAVEGYTTTYDGYDITNTHTPGETSKTVQKVWVDNDNQDGIRPANISVQLYAGDSEYGDPVVLNAANNWSYTWEKLPEKEQKNTITYTVKEVGEVSGYTTTYGEDKFIITNTHTPTTVFVKGSKEWVDNNDQDGVRPASITIQLYADGVLKDSKEVTEKDDWTWKFDNLPKYANGKQIQYSVREVLSEKDATNYTSENVSKTFNIKNTHTPVKTEISGIKIWDDEDNQDGIRPASITVKLFANGVDTGKTATASAATGWEYTFTELDKYANGSEIKYTVQEINVADGYKDSYSENGLDVTNTHIPEKTSVTIEKKWQDSHDQDGIRPSSITVHLYVKGDDNAVKSATVVPDATTGEWKYTFTDLDKYADGELIEYIVKEDPVPGYDEPVYDGLTITNCHTPEKINISGEKEWDDVDNQDGKRPASITIRLLADGKSTGQSCQATAADNWNWKFTNLPKYAAGKEIVYTVTEDEVSDYSAVITGDAAKGFKIKNSYTPGKTSVSGRKTWDDTNNQDGKRPTSIKINLLADGVTIDSKTVTEDDDWSWSFTDLPEYKNGQRIRYTISEEKVTGYESTIEGYNVINTHTPETIAVSGSKTWEDENNQDGKRPVSITITLLANGEPVKTKEVTAADNWRWEFDNLDRYKDGKEIGYSVVETLSEEAAEAYSVEYPSGSFNVVNKHTPEKVSISGTKVWNDADNQDGVRPDSIKIHLFADGTELKDKTKTVSGADNWTWKFEDLDKYADGKLINYTISEEAVDNYSTGISKTGDYAYTVTNSYTPGKTSKTVVKNWEDEYNQDGVRPSEITVVLLANGEEAKVTDAKVTLSEANNWTYTWSDLDLKAKGFKIKYTVQEISKIEGYGEPSYSYNDNLMTVTNTHTPETTSISGSKVWKDENNQDGVRPDSITVTLYADGVATNRTAIVNADNNWKFSFTNLPKYKNVDGKGGKLITYTVSEEKVAGYTTSIAGSMADGYTIYNTHNPETTSISGFKKWNDNNNQDGVRPDSITVTLYADGVATDKTATVTAANNWQFSFTDLPKYAEGKQGQEIQYTVVEDAVDGYTAEVAGSMEADYTITNTHEPTKINVSGTKVWEDAYNQDGLRPTSIEVTLYANGKATDQTETVTASTDGKWSFTFKDLDKFINGKEVVYTVKEKAVTGYTTEITGNASDGILITNTHTPEKTNIAGKKSWEDNDNQDGKRPESITVNLLANGTVMQSMVVSAANNWEYSFTDLDVCAGGSKITYSVQEVVPEGYTVSYDGNNITNTYNPEKTDVNGIKTWTDRNNQDGIRPASITVKLYADGEYTGKSVQVSAATEWKYSFENLDKYKAGKKIEYSVQEDAVAGYTTNINGYNIENIHTPEETEINGTKTWDDAENRDGLRPESITIRLFADGTEVQNRTVTANDNWSWNFTDLPKFADGQEITYTITEDAVTDYTTKIDGYHVTNTHKPAVIEISGIKTWKDADDQDGKRPEKIIVYLYADGKLAETKEVTDALGWTYSFENLPKYKNVDGKGVDIEYTIKEEKVTDYSPTYDGYNITNSYTPEETSRTVTKLWDDGDNQDGTRPSSITVQLLANGKAYGDPVVLDEAHGWTYTWLKLPLKEKKSEIVYTVEELSVIEGYETTYSEDDPFIITNKHVPAEVDVEGVKTWEDGNDQDGLRPDSITVVLLADGIEYTRMDVTPAADGTWSWKFDDLPKFTNGNEIRYSIEEIAVDGYTSITDYEDGFFNLVNTHTPETVELSGNKTWNDSNDQDGMRPSSITIRLLADGVEVDSKTVTAADNWSWTFKDLPKNKNVDGTVSVIEYTITEDAVDGYTASYTDDGTGLINSYTPELTGRNVVKIWDDGNNADQIRPAYIEVQLYADGEVYGDAVVLNDANGWSHNWTGLQAKKGGQYIVYTVQEITNVSGYTTTVTESGTTFTIVNYHPVTPPPTPTPPTTPPSTPPDVTPTPTTPSITPTPEVPTPTPDDNEVLGARRGGAVLGARRGLDQAVLGKRRRPTTGDSAALIVWMITLFGAMGAATVSVIGLRKKEEEK